MTLCVLRFWFGISFCQVAALPKLEIKHFNKETNLQAWDICETACVCLLPWVVGATQQLQTLRSRMHRTIFYSCPGTPHTNQKAVNVLAHFLMSFGNKNPFRFLPMLTTLALVNYMCVLTCLCLFVLKPTLPIFLTDCTPTISMAINVKKLHPSK